MSASKPKWRYNWKETEVWSSLTLHQTSNLRVELLNPPT